MTTARDDGDTETTTTMVIMNWLLSIINEDVLEAADDFRQHLGNGDKGCNSKIFLVVRKELFMKKALKTN